MQFFGEKKTLFNDKTLRTCRILLKHQNEIAGLAATGLALFPVRQCDLPTIACVGLPCTAGHGQMGALRWPSSRLRVALWKIPTTQKAKGRLEEADAYLTEMPELLRFVISRFGA
jgi:hypothetical protein